MSFSRALVTTFALAFLAIANVAEANDFAPKAVALLQERCAKCHGADKGAANLRLHSAEALTAATEAGTLVPEDAESSEIYTRITLPKDDKKMMPKGGEPFTDEEKKLIADWINGGAQFVTLEQPAAEAPAAEAKPAEPAMQEEAKPAETPAPVNVAAADPKLVEEVTKLGGVVSPLFADSPLLTISFPTAYEAVDDAALDKIVALAPQVVSLNLAKTKITDAGAAKLAALVNMERLHLENTAVTDAGVKPLAALDRLVYLNLYNTKISDETLATVTSGLPALKSLFLWQCKVSYDKAKELMAARPTLEVNLGWDHPGVVRDRLTKEVERLKAELDAKTKAVTEAEAKLTEEKKALQALEDQSAEIAKQLEALGK